MLLTNTVSISFNDKTLHIQFQQFIALSTTRSLKSRRKFPFFRKIVSISSVTHVTLEKLELIFAFRTFTPVACNVVSQFMMKTAKRVFAMVSGTAFEPCCFVMIAEGSTNETIATLRCFEGPLFTTKTAECASQCQRLHQSGDIPCSRSGVSS